MELNQKYKAGFLSLLDTALSGDVIHIPNPLDRVGDAFKLMQSRYHLIQGATGSGKTSFADYMYILGPQEFIKNNPDIHWEVCYFSLERKEAFKHARWISWMIKRDTGRLIPADDILGFGDVKLTKEWYDFIRGYDSEMDAMLDHIQMRDGKIKPDVVKRTIETRARDLGTYYYTDGEFAWKAGDAVYLEAFTDKNLFEATKAGNRRYIELEHKGEKFKLYQDDHRYFLHNPKTFVFIIVDGINLLGSKEDIDEVSLLLADSRDKFGFSPVVITQQNRAQGDIQRVKLHGADMTPQLEDVYKTSQCSFDCDVAIGIFDPYRYKAVNKFGSYFGYQIVGHPPQGSMMHPRGFSRFRSCHILKNNFGMDGAMYGLRFTGESGHFETLPLPDTVELDQIYSEIMQGL